MVQKWSHEGCVLAGNLNLVFLPWESGFGLHVFLHLFFIIIPVFPATSRKRIEQLLPQSPNLPFHYGSVGFVRQPLQALHQG